MSEKIDFDGPNGCWVWTAWRNKRGYGYTSNGVKEKNVEAHRMSWRVHFGDIPVGMFVCHRCDNPSCVNPGHLFLGTHQDNVTDCAKKGRNVKGEKWQRCVRPRIKRGTAHYLAKLNEDVVRAIRASTESRTQLAHRYGVTVATISDVLKRATWAHVA